MYTTRNFREKRDEISRKINFSFLVSRFCHETRKTATLIHILLGYPVVGFEWYLDGIISLVNDVEVLIMVETFKGKQRAYYRGNCFNQHKRLANGSMRYQCEYYGTQSCRCYLHELNGHATFVDGEHNHPPNAARIHQLQVRRNSHF